MNRNPAKEDLDACDSVTEGNKLKHESTASKPSDKLRQDKALNPQKSKDTSDKGMGTNTDKNIKSKFRIEKNKGNIDTATEISANQKPRKPLGMTGGLVQNARVAAWAKLHGKIHEVEHENVGVETSHRAELMGERAIRAEGRFLKRRALSRPARVASRLQRKSIRKNTNLQFRKMVRENPALRRKSIVSRYVQKRRLRKLYHQNAKAAAKVTAKTTKQTALVAIAITRRIANAVGAVILLVKSNPKVALILIALILLVVIIVSCMSSALTIGNSVTGAIGASTFPVEDAEMLAAQALYAEWEAALQYKLDNFEALNPGYDEYRFDLDEIWHDPYVLISILCSLHEGAWTLEDVIDTLERLFDLQYTLTITITVEVRFRTESHTSTCPETGLTYSETVIVQYNHYICTVILRNFNLSHLPIHIMSQDQLSRYALFMATLGNRPDLFPVHLFPRASTLREPGRHDIPREYLDADPVFAAMMAEATRFVGFPYIWGGSNPSTSFDCSGFVSWVLNQSGWNVGRLGVLGLRSISTPISSADRRPGDLIFFIGTFNAPLPGPTHVGIYVGSGMMIHAGNPIGFVSINTPFWQNHFYGFRRP